MNWEKSSFCGSNACVEVAGGEDGTVQVRDSKDPDGPVLHMTAEEWAAVEAGIRAGEFDIPNP